MDLVWLVVVAGIFGFFVIAARTIGRAGGGPVDEQAASRRAILYFGIVLVVAVMLPVVIYDDFKIPRRLFGG